MQKKQLSESLMSFWQFLIVVSVCGCYERANSISRNKACKFKTFNLQSIFYVIVVEILDSILIEEVFSDWTALALQTGNIFAWNQLYQTFAAELSAGFLEKSKKVNAHVHENSKRPWERLTCTMIMIIFLLFIASVFGPSDTKGK